MTKLDKRAFFIMAFGRSDLDNVWNHVYKPVSNSLGFEAIRIDERDNGRVKIDQIINEISIEADIIIGDLTYERQNCYFELGFARGTRKEDEIIYCARQDHINHLQYRSKFFSSDAPWSFKFSLFPTNLPPKVHFDLAGYDILTWDPTNLDKFKTIFDNRLNERLTIIRARTSIPTSTTSIPKVQLKTATINLDSMARDFRKKAEES